MAKKKKKTNKKTNSAQDVQGLETQGSVESSDKTSKSFYILAFLSAIFIMIAVPFGAFYIAISYNVKGIRDTYQDDIKKIPLLNFALGEVPDPEDPSKLTIEELREYYVNYKKKNEKLEAEAKEKDKEIDKLKKESKESKELEGELTKAENENKKLEAKTKKIKTDYDTKKKELVDEKKEIDNLIATGDKEGFKEYFEKVDSKNAEEIYEKIKATEIEDKEAKEFANTYEQMDADAVAKIFETMGDNKINLITDLLKFMEKESTGEILGAMDEVLAAKITEKLANEYMYKLN
ncbi:MAG: hypothetical protein ABF289_13105 [Clostridiales bacterium]